MGIVSGIVVYLCIWWTVLFCTLPLWVQPVGENDIGNLPGAPEVPHLKKKFILTSAISLVIWIMIYILIQIELVNFYDIAAEMFERRSE